MNWLWWHTLIIKFLSQLFIFILPFIYLLWFLISNFKTVSKLGFKLLNSLFKLNMILRLLLKICSYFFLIYILLQLNGQCGNFLLQSQNLTFLLLMRVCLSWLRNCFGLVRGASEQYSKLSNQFCYILALRNHLKFWSWWLIYTLSQVH